MVYTEAKILDWVLSAIDGEAIVVESYGWARCIEAITKKKRGSMAQDALRESDRWFFDYSKIRNVLEAHNVEFLNVTEEVWANQIVEPDVIRHHVEDKYPAVYNEEMYSMVPSRLYELKHGTFLSLAKLKFLGRDIVLTLSIKNLFGMIPGPDRGKFHGKDNKLLNQSILDIYKIYRSIFSITGVTEAIFTASRGMSLDQVIYKDPKIAWACRDTLELDTVVAAQVGIDPHEIEHFKLTADCFGKWNEDSILSAKNHVINEFH